MVLNEMTENERLELLRNNDYRVFQYYFYKFFAPLCFFATRLIEDDEEAKDIVICIYKKFWEIQKNFVTSDNIRAFLYISVRNSCFNYLKYRSTLLSKAKDYYSYKQQLSILEETEEIFENKLIRHEIFCYIDKEVQKLPEKCRLVFILTYYNGLRADEIAKQLNISVSNVTTQRYNGLKIIRSVLYCSFFT